MVNFYEIFITENTIYSYDINLGVRPSSIYYIENDYIFHSQLNSKFQKIGKLNFDDILTLKGNAKELRFKKIDRVEVLENFVNETIDEDNFWAAYLVRYESWKKSE